MHAAEMLERGREAFGRRAWPDTFELLERADRTTELEPADLERLATSAYLTGHDERCSDAWRRAHQAWLAQGRVDRAVRSAFWLAFGLMQRGDVAQGSGWLARAGRLVEEHEPDMVERGYLQVPAGLRALGEGEPGRALERFDEAETLGRRYGDRDLTALGVLGRGEALLHLGRTSDGLRLFDEAMVSVTSGETSPTIAGLVYCAVIDGCHHVFDVRRAREWTAALERWCDQQPGLVPYRGQCLVHRAQVLQIRGDWDAAIAELEQARRWLSNPPHPAVGMADYQLGELRRLRGELRTAEGAYRRAHAAGRDPQPGLALLRLAEGAVETSASAVEHALASAADPVTRAQLLPAYAEIMLTAGRHDAAAMAADELEALAADGAPLLGAIAAQTRGSIMLADGDAEAALVALRAALDAWQELGAPYEAAQVRMLIADACGQLHDRERAGLECEAAREVFDALGATPALVHLDRVLADAARRAADPSAAVPRRPLPVTGRELDLLRLVAAGRTNREIASELAISEKTVERHLGNVFTKLGVSNRTAAVAHAYRHGML